jgi:hypothetical protein
MTRSFRNFIVALLVTLPLVTSCSDPQAPMVPQQSSIERQDGLIGDLLGTVTNTLTSTVSGVVGLLDNILSGPDANGKSNYAWIDADGGTIKTAAYTLTVPRKAVRTRTKFVIEPVNNGTYSVELHAYRQGLLGLIDVGGRGFDRPVELTISYRKAEGVTDERKLAIIYIASPKEVELRPSKIDRRDKEVTAKLDHFSKYAMVQN